MIISFYLFLIILFIHLFPLLYLIGKEAVFAVSYSLTLVGDDATRADGVSLLPLNKKWTALALSCVGVLYDGLKLTAEDEPTSEEVQYTTSFFKTDLLVII